LVVPTASTPTNDELPERSTTTSLSTNTICAVENRRNPRLLRVRAKCKDTEQADHYGSLVCDGRRELGLRLVVREHPLSCAFGSAKVTVVFDLRSFRVVVFWAGLGFISEATYPKRSPWGGSGLSEAPFEGLKRSDRSAILGASRRQKTWRFAMKT
jgi:hypothetical protein